MGTRRSWRWPTGDSVRAWGCRGEPLADVVTAEIDIDAPIERVWQVLRDFTAYPEWNPFTPRVESTLRVGDPIHLYVRLRSEHPSHRVEYVTLVEPPNKMCWDMQLGARFLLHAERCQVLTARGDQTHYVTEDRFHGLLTPLVMASFGQAMRRGFHDCARALKQRAESR